MRPNVEGGRKRNMQTACTHSAVSSPSPASAATSSPRAVLLDMSSVRMACVCERLLMPTDPLVALQFEERQALAAKRSAELQAKQAAERAQRIQRETADKQRRDAEARAQAQRERDALVARERRKRDELEAKQRADEQRKERMERARLQREQEARNDLKKATAKREEQRQAKDKRRFQQIKDRAFANAGSSSSSPAVSPAKKKHDDDGFLSSSGPSASVLTREERRNRQRMAIFGFDDRPRSRRANGARRKPAQSPGGGSGPLVALGTVKRDHRSIDEIERDLHEAKRRKLAAVQAGSTADAAAHDRRQRELETSVRRQRAMNEKRGIVEEEEPRAEPSRPSNGTANGKRIPTSSSSKPASFGSSNHLGLSPADYLPGAPIRSDLLVSRAAVATAESAKDKRQKPKDKRPEKEPDKAVPKRKETARDRFLREEEERKRQQQQRLKQQSGSQRFEEDDEDESEEEEEYDEDEYESDDVDDEDAHASGRAKGDDYRDEIWKLFGRKRSDYVNRLDDESDDDMEADLQSVAREEAISARHARMEDEREERALRKHEAEKAARKAAAAAARRR